MVPSYHDPIVHPIISMDLIMDKALGIYVFYNSVLGLVMTGT